MDDDRGLLDVDQAAARLGVPIRWIRRAIAERRIPFVKVGRYVRFVPDDLDAYVGARRVERVDR